MDNRIAPRSRTLKAATIAFNGGVIDCVLRNLSDTGAQLEVTSPVGIPDQFELMLTGESAHRPCRVVWRKATRIGVSFA